MGSTFVFTKFPENLNFETIGTLCPQSRISAVLKNFEQLFDFMRHHLPNINFIVQVMLFQSNQGMNEAVFLYVARQV